MNKKIKTSLISLFLVGIFTILKFFFYFMSDSVAVLSESWHSFSDIATTALVLTSLVIVSIKHKKVLALEKKEPVNCGKPDSKGKLPDPELVVAFLISLILLIVSMNILYNSVTGEAIKVNRPFLTGVIFIVLSFGSYFLFKLQASVAESEDSSALKADSLHSKTDMIVSLTTGFSLILYYYGVNIDRLIGAFIALFIFSFSLEMLVNVFTSIISGKGKFSQNHSFNSIFFKLFDSATYVTLGTLICDKTGLSLGKGRVSKTIAGAAIFIFTRMPVIVGGLTVILFISTCFYTVSTDEEGLILRFGRIINSGKPVQSGLHIKMPFPFEKIVKIQSKKVMTLEVGNKSNGKRSLLWVIDHGDNEKFISGDNNLFLPYVVLHYTIKNPYHYYAGHSEPQVVLEKISYQVLTNIFVQNRFFDLALFKRRTWVREAQNKIQAGLDELNTGIKLETLNIKDLHPPKKAAFAFENVIAAYQQKQEMINVAAGKKNAKIPLARGNAVNIKNAALAYVDEKVKRAEGETGNYLLRLEGFETGKSILKKNLISGVAEDVLKGRDKIIYDPSTNISSGMLYSEEYIIKKIKFY